MSHFTLSPAVCPTCQSPPKGTIEKCVGISLIENTGADDNTFEYSGTTEYFDDEQKTVRKGNMVQLMCPDGHLWWAKHTEIKEKKK